MPQTANCLGKKFKSTNSNLYGLLKTPATKQFGMQAIIIDDTIHYNCFAWHSHMRQETREGTKTGALNKYIESMTLKSDYTFQTPVYF